MAKFQQSKSKVYGNLEIKSGRKTTKFRKKYHNSWYMWYIVSKWGTKWGTKRGTPEPCPLPLLTRNQSKRDTTRDPTTNQFDQTDQTLDTLLLLL